MGFLLAALLALAAPANAGFTYGPVISTATQRATQGLAGTYYVAATSNTISTPTVVLDGAKGGVNASSFTATYGIRAATITATGLITSAGITVSTGIFNGQTKVSSGTLILDGNAATAFLVGTSSVVVMSNQISLGLPVTATSGSSVTLRDLFAVGTSTLIVKNARVGVGTTNPAVLLHVAGQSASSSTLVGTTSLDGDITSGSNPGFATVTTGGTTGNIFVGIGAVGAGPEHQFYRTRSVSPSGDANTALGVGDVIGGFGFAGADGTQYVSGPEIRAAVSAAVSAGVVPQDLIFLTGGAEYMRFTNAGQLWLGKSNPANLQVSSGTVYINGNAATSFQIGNGTFTVTSNGITVPLSRTKAQIDAITPSSAELGGFISCSNCTNAYELCRATAAVLSGFAATRGSGGCGTGN